MVDDFECYLYFNYDWLKCLRQKDSLEATIIDYCYFYCFQNNWL